MRASGNSTVRGVLPFNSRRTFFATTPARRPSKKLISSTGCFGPNFRRTAGEPFVVGDFLESAVHAGRTDLQDVARTRNQFLNIEDHAQLLTDAFAVSVQKSSDKDQRADRFPCPSDSGTRSMYTLRKRCLPTFHSTSTTSSPSDRATLSAASRIFSNCKRSLPASAGPNACSRFRVQPRSPDAKPGGPTKKWACAHSIVRPVTDET